MSTEKRAAPDAHRDAATAAGRAAPASDAPEPGSGRRESAGRFGEDARTDVFEVFRQEKDGDSMRHAGNVVAPDAELAMHYARELYGRRQESVRLWVVPRAAITDVSDPDLLLPPLDRSFKKPGGYVMRDKLELAKQRAAESSAKRPSTGRQSAPETLSPPKSPSTKPEQAE
jgi:ring-1,2-phenylacetyl-CoA epoxidase subunit PaaB